MEQNCDFRYFTGWETMQFAFIPVPMALLSDPRYENLSSDAKLLYALLLNRMNLSRKNGWFDEKTVYLSTILLKILLQICIAEGIKQSKHCRSWIQKKGLVLWRRFRAK